VNILLINKNMVVSRLVRLCAKELNATLDERASIADIAKAHYDVVIIDESALTPQLESSLEMLSIGSTVILSNNPLELMHRYDFELKKPFLPRDLSSILLEITHTQPTATTPSPNDWLEKVLMLEPSTIKAILAGAKVHITIEFPKELSQ